MIVGLPWGAWLLILLASVPGLILGLAAYRAHGRPPASRRKEATPPTNGAADGPGNADP